MCLKFVAVQPNFLNTRVQLLEQFFDFLRIRFSKLLSHL